jgi:hypothetical protein
MKLLMLLQILVLLIAISGYVDASCPHPRFISKHVCKVTEIINFVFLNSFTAPVLCKEEEEII